MLREQPKETPRSLVLPFLGSLVALHWIIQCCAIELGARAGVAPEQRWSGQRVSGGWSRWPGQGPDHTLRQATEELLYCGHKVKLFNKSCPPHETMKLAHLSVGRTWDVKKKKKKKKVVCWNFGWWHSWNSSTQGQCLPVLREGCREGWTGAPALRLAP